MAGQTGPKRTEGQRKSDTLEAYYLRMVGYTYEGISRIISARADYDVSNKTISNDLAQFDPSSVDMVYSIERSTNDSLHRLEAILRVAMPRLHNDPGNPAFIKSLTDTISRIHALRQQCSNEFSEIAKNIDYSKVTPEWRAKMMNLIKEVQYM